MALSPTDSFILPYGAGPQLYIGFQAETVPGTPANTTLNYIPVESDQVSFTYDPGRTVIPLATGDLYPDFTFADQQAKLTGSFEFPIFPSVGANLLSLCGLTSGSNVGSGATFTVTATGGVITAIAVTAGGTLYNAPPKIVITGAGTGATAFATIAGGIVTSVTVTNGGTGYTGTPTAAASPVGSLGPIQIPQYITFYVGRASAEEVYPGCRCKMITITATNNKPLMCKLEFEGISVPITTGVTGVPSIPQPDVTGGNVGYFGPGGVGAVDTGTGYDPTMNNPTLSSYVQEKPYIWSDLQPVQLLNAASVIQNQMESIEISIAFDLASFYGNHQSNLPSELIPTGVSVSGKFTRLFTDVYEYALFKEFCSLAGPMSFVWDAICNNSNNRLAITLPAAFYKTHDYKNPMKGAIVEDFTIGTIKTLDAATSGSPLLFGHF